MRLGKIGPKYQRWMRMLFPNFCSSFAFTLLCPNHAFSHATLIPTSSPSLSSHLHHCLTLKVRNQYFLFGRKCKNDYQRLCGGMHGFFGLPHCKAILKVTRLARTLTPITASSQPAHLSKPRLHPPSYVRLGLILIVILIPDLF